MQQIRLLVVLILALVHTCLSYGQLTLGYNRIRPGDKLLKYQVEYKNPGPPGENIFWDFSKLKIINENYSLTYSTPELVGDNLYVLGSTAYPKTGVGDSDLIVAHEHYTQYFYRLKGDTLVLLGHENPLTRLEYVVPYTQTIFPINYGGITTYPYQARGIYSQTDSISTEGLVTTLADAYGKMVLPSGDTLNQVLRVRTLQSIASHSDTVVPHRRRVLETSRWYTKGYRYPVFETVRNYNPEDSTTYFQTAFFFPPQDHYYLDQDPANAALLEELWNLDAKNKGSQEANSVDSGAKGVSIPGLLNCKFYPNPVVSDLSVDYEVTTKASVSFGLYSIDGFPVSLIPAKAHEPGAYAVSFNCSGLFPRNYILRVTANDKVANGLIIKK